MFTIGLFTTHIPYIAFVLFYAGFFVFGIEKASAGAFGEGAQLVPEVISVSADTFPQMESEGYTGSFYLQGSEYGYLMYFDEKAQFLFHAGNFLKSADFCFSEFSRPPPVN